MHPVRGKRGDGSVSFDDTVGQVRGTWVLGRPPASTPGLLLYVMVESVAATVEAIVAHGARSCSRSARMRLRSPPDSGSRLET